MLEITDICGPLGSVAGNGRQAGKDPIGTDALHLVPLNGGTGLALAPVHDGLAAELLAGSHLNSIHGLRLRIARSRARGAANFAAIAGALSGATIFSCSGSVELKDTLVGLNYYLHCLKNDWLLQYRQDP